MNSEKEKLLEKIAKNLEETLKKGIKTEDIGIMSFLKKEIYPLYILYSKEPVDLITNTLTEIYGTK